VGKAEEFLDQARIALAASRFDAAMLNAIHAAISAADAVTVALGQRRSSDPDHQRAVDLLEEVAGRSQGIRHRVRQMRMLLARKNAVEYEARRATRKEASDAVERASRILLWAGETLEQAKL
jgi:HEPN domain-containing protein